MNGEPPVDHKSVPVPVPVPCTCRRCISPSMDLMSEIIARLPKSSYDQIAAASDEFEEITKSADIMRRRNCLARDNVFLVFEDQPDSFQFKLTGNGNSTELVSVGSFRPAPGNIYSVFSCYPWLFILCGPPVQIWKYDPIDSKSVYAPLMPTTMRYLAAGLIKGGKILVVGEKNDESKTTISLASFDMKMNCWINPSIDREFEIVSSESLAKGNGLYSISKSLSLSPFAMPYLGEKWSSCLCNEELYVFYEKYGLSWYSRRQKQWKIVDGLTFKMVSEVKNFAIAEFNGDLVLVRVEEEKGVNNILLTPLSLEKKCEEDSIIGKAKATSVIGSVPKTYNLIDCFSLLG